MTHFRACENKPFDFNYAKFPLFPFMHIPWCVQKCPYCDFNSHVQKGGIPLEQEYVQHLIADLRADLEKYRACIQNRPSIQFLLVVARRFIFSGKYQFSYWRNSTSHSFSENIEITMEANPGTVEAGVFKGYVDAGVTRISMGIQKF